MAAYYDDLETRDPEAREAAHLADLPELIGHAQANAPALRRMLAGVSPSDVTSRAALAELPVLRKSGLAELQSSDMPFGGLITVPPGGLARIFSSPGPIYDPEATGSDFWRMARALFAAGFRAGDVVHNTFGYHLTPAGSMLETGAHAMGCAVIPAGGGNADQQVQVIADVRPDGYVGTPSFLRILLEKGAELGADLTCLKKACVSAEALPPSLRETIRDLGVAVVQCYASADLGLIAYESEAVEGMIVDEGLLLEIVRPGTGDPVPAGEVGEVVATSFNRAYPLIRFATGDLSAILSGISPCGRTNMRIKGWMGRADQRTKVRAMFVAPEQIAEVTARHSEILKARLVVSSDDNRDVMTLHCETDGGGENLASAIVETLRAVCNLRGEVALVAPGTLANDGKVIDDVRSYE